MDADVVIHAGLLESYDFTGKTVVVIDAFRATSVIVTGLQNGAREFIPVTKVEEAVTIKDELPEVLLGGEREGIRIDGFDLDNSPLRYTREAIEGKSICITTTNGTRALNGVLNADSIYLGSFLNLSAVAGKVVGKDTVIVCSGSEDSLSLEDSLCAGGILYAMELLTSVNYSDSAFMHRTLYSNAKDDLKGFLSSGTHYRYLKNKGFDADLDFCLTVDKCTVVPSYNGRSVH